MNNNGQKKRIKKPRIFCGQKNEDIELEDQQQRIKSREEINREFSEQQTFEIWLIFTMKFFTSLIFLIDDLTFLIFCIYEFKMSQMEAGTLFAISAICLFIYGLTISGPLIDKLGVKWSLMIGLCLYAIAKLILFFAETREVLYITCITLLPLGISIIYPTLLLGIKKLTKENVRPQGLSLFYAAMILGAVFAGPVVDFIRHDFKTNKIQYKKLYLDNEYEYEDMEHEFSAWRMIQLVGFCVFLVLIITLFFYDPYVEKQFEEGFIDWEAINKMTCCDIFRELVSDYKFWRFLLFSFVIVGPKLVFALLFFMLPKIIMQDYGEDAPFGIYISIAPLLIIIFLLIIAPIQANYDAYDLILLGTSIATLGPIPMFFGMNIVDFLIFIVIISFAEALYSPMINVFTFNFTKPGREGTFLTLTAAPIYFTMACTGLLGGFLLENYYPSEENETHKKRPWIIWTIIITISAISVLILFLGRNYFDCADEDDQKNDKPEKLQE